MFMAGARWITARCPSRAVISRNGTSHFAENGEGRPRGRPFSSLVPAMMMMVVMVVMVTMHSRPGAHIDADAMMVVMVVMVPDHYLGGPGARVPGLTLVVRFQERQGVRNRIEKVAIAGRLRKFRPARRSRLGGGHRSKGCGRSQQAG
jgi:hypothetical protein